MGVIYMVACRDCKVCRDLDKFYFCREVESRNEAMALSEELLENAHSRFGAALLASFMAVHMGHNCTVFTDSMEALSEELDPLFGAPTKEDGIFWKLPE